MKVMPSNGLLSELHRTAFWQPDASRNPIEHLVEYILTGTAVSDSIPEIAQLAEKVLRFDLQSIRAVVLGGGTGMSTIIGGNSRMSDWPDQPEVGIKQEFAHLTSVVCTTDDGGSTGLLLKLLPIIGVGDIRKLLISSILPRNLRQTYRLDDQESAALVRMIHRLFNHRFDKGSGNFKDLANPLLVLPKELQYACPKPLENSLRTLGAFLSKGPAGSIFHPAGHSMGNLLLTAAILHKAQGWRKEPPGLRDIQCGIDHIAALIGAPVGRIHAATAAPGQLKFRYANGVEVYGQSKSSQARRDSPVDRVITEFARNPVVSKTIAKAIQNADVIIYAPGSLYSSTLPVLQLDPIAAAIRYNHRALKILCANSWIQEGETDISLKNQGRGFLVSELIEACDRNIKHGMNGLVNVVLSANLEHLPGSILRNYALEGKSPIHLDRDQVVALGVHSVEATLFSQEQQTKAQIIQHDPQRFALAIRTLLYADKYLKRKPGYSLRSAAGRKKVRSIKSHKQRDNQKSGNGPFLCQYLESISKILNAKKFDPPRMKDFFIDLAWDNRDIHPSHLGFFKGMRVLPAKQWNRSTQWDNVLGYYDQEDGYLVLHQDLLSNPSRLKEDLLIAVGESLLGRYIEERRWIKLHGARRYEIVLKPEKDIHSYLSAEQMHTYLQLARMVPDPEDNRIYGISINTNGGFLPPGLLFGLMYSWYLSGKGRTMEYEMSLLRWPLKSLIPLHAEARIYKESLVRFFRTEIFGHEE
jgi:uncharacterized cofD-like protein